MSLLLLSCLLAITFLSQLAPFGGLSPAVSDLSKDFSEKFCQSIRNGIPSEKAGETAAAQISKGLLFSPVMSEIMSTPKQDLAKSLSNNIFDECGKDLEGTKEELDNYLAQLAAKLPSKSTNSFHLAPIRQKSSR